MYDRWVQRPDRHHRPDGGNRHLFNVHLGETIAPYVALEPLKSLLPLKRGEAALLFGYIR